MTQNVLNNQRCVLDNLSCSAYLKVYRVVELFSKKKKKISQCSSEFCYLPIIIILTKKNLSPTALLKSYNSALVTASLTRSTMLTTIANCSIGTIQVWYG